MYRKNIIYNGNHIRAYSAMYDTDYLFITFNNRGEIYGENSHDYWGGSYFNKHKISSIGIVAKEANWFPIQEMHEIANVVNIITQNHRVITYGCSMGGYGAIKFSGLFNSNVGLAFSPQWSVNPEDINDYRWPEFKFDPHLRGGEAITQSDIAGDNYFFIDPRENLDKDHGQFLSSFKGVQKVIVPFSWHGSILHFSANKDLQTILMAATNPETTSLSNFRKITRQTRINNLYYHNIKIKYLRDRLIASKNKHFHELKKETRYLNTQEEILLYAICVYLEGNIEQSINIIKNEIHKGLDNISITDLEFIIVLCKKYDFQYGCEVLEPIREAKLHR